MIRFKLHKLYIGFFLSVSGSFSITDTCTMVSGLEHHNFDLTKTPSVCNQSTECKEETTDQDSGIYESRDD